MTASQIQWEYEKLKSVGVSLKPPPPHKNPFRYLSPTDNESLPKYTSKINVVYFFYGSEHELLYVGRTNDFVKRWYDHCNSEKQMHLVKSVAVHVFSTKSEVMFYEAEKILELEPLWNVAGRDGVVSGYKMFPESVDTFSCNIKQPLTKLKSSSTISPLTHEKFYLIYNEDKKTYFEGNIVRGSWFDGAGSAQEFESEQDAKVCLHWLGTVNSTENCVIQEVNTCTK